MTDSTMCINDQAQGMYVDHFLQVMSKQRKVYSTLSPFDNPTRVVHLSPWEKSFKKVVAHSLVKGVYSFDNVGLSSRSSTMENTLFLE